MNSGGRDNRYGIVRGAGLDQTAEVMVGGDHGGVGEDGGVEVVVLGE